MGDIETLEQQNNHVKTLKLQGLGENAKEILREKELKNEEKWEELIALYQGNPTWLNIIASTIINLCDGQVSRFLSDEEELFLGDIQISLDNHLERLSELENKVIKWLANQNKSIDIAIKPTDFEISKAKFLQVIQSLTRRCLIAKVVNGESTHFQLNPIFKAYLKSGYLNL